MSTSFLLFLMNLKQTILKTEKYSYNRKECRTRIERQI